VAGLVLKLYVSDYVEGFLKTDILWLIIFFIR
jgi:hypothetical protein